jgi:hypothetical protein
MLVAFLSLSQGVGRISKVNSMAWYTRTSLLAMFVLYEIFPPLSSCTIADQGPQETYTMLSYNAPKCCTEPITLAGLSVTDNGFGVWNVTFPVAGGDCDWNGNSSSPPAGVSAKGSKRVSH